MGGTCITHGRGEEYIKNISRKPDGERPLDRRRRREMDNIKTII
jgi:hypothetical protein